MIEHLPECEIMEPCSKDTPEHGFCSRQQTYCIHCERACICERLRACTKRIASEWKKFARDQFDAGHADALAKAKRIIAGFLDIDRETGDRRCADPACDLCVVAPLIYAAVQDLSAGGKT